MPLNITATKVGGKVRVYPDFLPPHLILMLIPIQSYVIKFMDVEDLYHFTSTADEVEQTRSQMWRWKMVA